jgi:hypothetical protein
MNPLNQGALQAPSQPPQLDQDAVNLAKAIRQTESQGNFQALGKSGEIGGYQFMPETWGMYSKKYLGRDVPLEAASPDEQNEVAYKRIKEWKDKGYNPGQIASMWNAGEGKPDAYLDPSFKGVNAKGVQFDVPGYATKVATAYQQLKQTGGSTQTPQGLTSQATGGQPASAPEAPAEQGPGLMQRLAQTVASPFLKVASSANAIMNVGNQAEYDRIQKEGSDFGYLGKQRPVGAGFDVTKGLSENKDALLDAVGTGAEIASFVAPGGAATKAVTSLRGGKALATAGKTAIAGAEMGALQGAGAALQSEDKSLGNVIKQTVIGTAAGGATGGAIGAVGGKLGTLFGQGKKAAAVADNTKGLLELEKANAPLRKFSEKSRSDGFDPIKDIASTDLLKGSVDKDGVLRTVGEGRAVEEYKGAMKEMEGVVRKNLEKEGASVKASELQKDAFAAIDDAGLQGAAKKRAQQEALADIEQFIIDSGSQDIPLTLVHDAKVSRYSTLNYMNPESSIAGKALAKGYKEAVERASKSVEVKSLNKELRRHMVNLDFLEKLDGKRVAGGRLAKYFASTVGGMAGSHFGPLGTIVGADIGSRIMGRNLAGKFGKTTGGLIPEASAAMKRAVRVGEGKERRLPVKSMASEFTNEIPTIDAGKTPKPKAKKSLPGLPTIKY